MIITFCIPASVSLNLTERELSWSGRRFVFWESLQFVLNCTTCMSFFGEGPLAALELYNSLENLLPFSRHPDGINYVKGTGKYLAFEQYLVMCIYL